MSNRTQAENDAIMLQALRSAGEKGLTLDEIRVALFGSADSSKSLVKKMLERLKSKGQVQIKLGKLGPYYTIVHGR